MEEVVGETTMVPSGAAAAAERAVEKGEEEGAGVVVVGGEGGGAGEGGAERAERGAEAPFRTTLPTCQSSSGRWAGVLWRPKGSTPHPSPEAPGPAPCNPWADLPESACTLSMDPQTEDSVQR